MDTDVVISMFPLQAEVTQEILDTAAVYDTRNCKGAKTLKSALEKAGVEATDIYWGSNTGEFRVDGKRFLVSTKRDMMTMQKPATVTINLRK